MLGACGRPKAGARRGARAGRGNRRQMQREHDIEDDYYTDSDDDEVSDTLPFQMNVSTLHGGWGGCCQQLQHEAQLQWQCDIQQFCVFTVSLNTAWLPASCAPMTAICPQPMQGVSCHL